MSLTTDEVTMETREASPSHFLIKIESFSLLGQHGIHKYETGEFSAGGYKWRLVIYPNDDKTGKDADYISVYLAISDTSFLPVNWEVNAVFSIFLFNQISGNYLYSLGRTRRFLAMKSEWGFSKFISKNVLKDPSNGYLINDNCIFGAEVFVVENSAVSECLSLKNVTDVRYKRDWKISNFSKLGDLWTSEKFTAEGYKWEFLLYPKGRGDAKGRSAATDLRLLDSKRLKARFAICIKDQANNRHHKYTGNAWFSASGSTWGWDEFIELASLADSKKGFVVNDCCLLEIEISVQAVA